MVYRKTQAIIPRAFVIPLGIALVVAGVAGPGMVSWWHALKGNPFELACEISTDGSPSDLAGRISAGDKQNLVIDKHGTVVVWDTEGDGRPIKDVVAISAGSGFSLGG